VLIGGAVLAIVGGASPSTAEDAAMRGDEVVAREAPGSGAGIAVIRGNDRVQLMSERDGWSEIRLRDGRRAWVPSNDIVRLAVAAAAATPRTEPSPRPSPIEHAGNPAEAVGADAVPDGAIQELRREIARLRQVADDLADETRRSEATPLSRLPEGASWVLGALALAIGLLIGSAWERHRGRRDRSLRF
jgi:hypothetical protein